MKNSKNLIFVAVLLGLYTIRFVGSAENTIQVEKHSNTVEQTSKNGELDSSTGKQASNVVGKPSGTAEKKLEPPQINDASKPTRKTEPGNAGAMKTHKETDILNPTEETTKPTHSSQQSEFVDYYSHLPSLEEKAEELIENTESELLTIIAEVSKTLKDENLITRANRNQLEESERRHLADLLQKEAAARLVMINRQLDELEESYL